MEPDLSISNIKINSPENYFNRELSFLEFNKRVLEEAEDSLHPLLERLKFIVIFSSNLDEFFMIRIAGLKGQIQAGVVELSMDGKTPQEQLAEIRKGLLPLYEQQQILLMEDILPKLEKENIIIHDIEDISTEERDFINNFFCESVLSVLTPLSVDPAHPFPRIFNRSLNIVFVLNDILKKNLTEKRVAFVQLPPFLPRFVQLPRPNGHHFVLMEQIVISNADMLFPGLEIVESNTFRVTRDADIEIAEDEAEDLLTEIAEQIKHRKWGTAAVRLEVSEHMPANLVEMLKDAFELENEDIYAQDRPLNLPDFMRLTKIDIRHLKDIPFQTRVIPEFVVEGTALFDIIKQKDYLVHHPYDSFTNSVLKFINIAADDSSTVAIKITLYRTGLNSPVVEALKRAAENGKDVTAFVELKARFDEENNIIWARELEKVGVQVIYGVLGLKTHCKIAMVVRNEGSRLKTYLHLGTGNYNHITARIYTDVGLFTSNDEFGLDAVHLFNYLTGYSHHKNFKHFIVAPVNLRQKIVELINRETELHTEENPGLIFAKMNSIAHEEVTQALYRASQKGVKIKLVVRGICCLKPGIPGLSDNVEVRSIIGRFLEHSRIFYFKNGGNEEFYLSSADWMTRNLHRRVELMFPVIDKHLQKQLMDLLKKYWKDNKKSWLLMDDGRYEKIPASSGAERISVQESCLEEIIKSRKKGRHKLIPYLKK